MTWLDWVLLVLLAVSIVSGLMRGLMKTIFDLVGLVVGVLLAGRFYAVLAPKLTFIPQENLAKIAAFVIIAAVIMVIAGILGSILKKVVSQLSFGWLDRLGGAVLGLALSAISLGVGLTLLAQFEVLGLEGAIGRSWLAGLLLQTYPLIKGLLPLEFGDPTKVLPL